MSREQGQVVRVRVVRRAGSRARGVDRRVVRVSLRIRLRRSDSNGLCGSRSGISAIAEVSSVVDATAALARSTEVNRILDRATRKLNGRAIASVAAQRYLRGAATT